MEYIPSDKVTAWAVANGYGDYIEAHAEYFTDYLANKPGKPYKDLDAAFRNCVRGDWGNIRRQLKMTEKKRDDWTATDATICAKAAELGIWSQGMDKFTLIRAIRERMAS